LDRNVNDVSNSFSLLAYDGIMGGLTGFWPCGLVLRSEPCDLE